MAKNNNLDDQIDLVASESALVSLPKSEIKRFDGYSNPYELQEFVDLIPEFHPGESLIGQLIAIHTIEQRSSFQFNTDFYVCDIEIVGYEGQHRAAFFSIPCKTFFRALEKIQVPLPIAVGVIRHNLTYGFQEANKFLAEQGLG